MSIVEQLTDYNDKIMKELEELIAKNKQQQEALTVKKKNLANLKVQLNAKKARIEATNDGYKDGYKDGLEKIQEELEYRILGKSDIDNGIISDDTFGICNCELCSFLHIARNACRL